jgi:hypothetical protein
VTSHTGTAARQHAVDGMGTGSTVVPLDHSATGPASPQTRQNPPSAIPPSIDLPGQAAVRATPRKKLLNNARPRLPPRFGPRLGTRFGWA